MTENTTATPPQKPLDFLGGEDAALRIAERLYDVMATDPRAARIRKMHGEDLTGIKALFGEYFIAWLGGRRTYFERGDRPCMVSAHEPFDITEDDRDAWMYCMRKALDDEPDLRADFREAMEQAIYGMADGLVKRG